MTPYDNVAEFERRVAEYAGADYGVAVNSCTSALTLAVKLALDLGGDGRVFIPRCTYVGVPYAIRIAGGVPVFEKRAWLGAYELKISQPLGFDAPPVIDSARRFHRDMYAPGSLWCLSFHETKHLPIGDGGMILTDNNVFANKLRRMRFDGRTPGVSIWEDTIDEPWALHCHMKPDVATRGLMLMAGVRDYNEDLPERYPDLSKMEAFK